MTLTKENYYSGEANRQYMSVSQYHDFINGFESCEAKAMAKIKRLWTEEPNDAMLIGSYVDSYFEGTLNEFKANTPQIFTLKGELKAPFKHAETIIKTAENDGKFMQYMNGQKQQIMTANLFGVDWKIRIDVLHDNCFVDLKVVRSIREKFWKDGGKCNFIDAYSYLDQGAIYQAVIEKNIGKKLPFYIAALSKDEIPDKEIIYVPDDALEMALHQIELNMPHIIALKNKDYPPVRCEKCDYCRSTKKLEKPISYYDL